LLGHREGDARKDPSLEDLDGVKLQRAEGADEEQSQDHDPGQGHNHDRLEGEGEGVDQLLDC
jgi:hypothetical protein